MKTTYRFGVLLVLFVATASHPAILLAQGAVLGYKLNATGIHNSGFTPSLQGAGGTIYLTGNPFNSGFIPGGMYVANANAAAGWQASYWLCYENTQPGGCTTPRFVVASQVNITVANTGKISDRVTLWWKYVQEKGRLQGVKVDEFGAPFTNPGASIKVGTSTFSATVNPYVAELLAGTHTVNSSVPAGYTVSYSVCNNCTSHPVSSFVQGSQVTITIHHDKYVDIHWKYTKIPPPFAAAVSGYKIGDDSLPTSAPTTTLTLIQPTGSTTVLTGNPYISGFFPLGTYRMNANAPTGYTSSYWLCYDKAACVTPSFVIGTSATLTLTGSGTASDYVTLWWKYSKIPPPLPAPVPTSTPRVIPGQVADKTVDWTRGEVLISNTLNMYNGHILKETSGMYPYKMWFFGWATLTCNNPSWPSGPTPCDAIYYARSTNGIAWEVYTGTGYDTKMNPSTWKPVIAAQNFYYDQVHNGDPSVVKVGSTYYMVYSATGNDVDGKAPGQPGDTDGSFNGIMGAVSTDGINWQRAVRPFFVAPGEAGSADTSDDKMYHRPSLMYENGKFRLWFDYWVSNTHGISLGYAELPMTVPSVSGFLNGTWQNIRAGNNPLIINFPNPNIVKVGSKYYGYSDSVVTAGASPTGWDSRQITEATSPDGINNWTFTGFIRPETGCAANHSPEAYSENGKIIVTYGCQKGGSPYDYHYPQIRRMTRNI